VLDVGGATLTLANSNGQSSIPQDNSDQVFQDQVSLNPMTRPNL
jgi:hypothetical protein